MTEKSLGQVAFEARLLHEDGFILPNEWAACAEEHAAWEAAAQAVACITDAERAVVEAAAAAHKQGSLEPCAWERCTQCPYLVALSEAVEALQKERG